MKRSNFRFIEVTVSYGGCVDFSLVFCVPYGLSMRRYHVGAVSPVPLEDWLVCDFPSILSRSLCLREPSNLNVNLSPFLPDRPSGAFPVYSGNTLPDSWTGPFIGLIASTFLNTYIYVCK